MVVGFIVAGCFAAAFCFVMWCCCKAASDADDREGRNWEDLD